MDKDQRQKLFTQVEQASELPMLVLALIFLVAIVLPTIMDLSQAILDVLDGIIWITWAIFALELSIKTYLAPNRKHYLTSHWPDVLTVAIPFLRPLRLLRVIIILIRTWSEIRRVLRQRTFSLIGITSLITIVLSALLVYAFERRTDGPIQSFPDALWWAVTTITTVGYGDTYPTTSAGRGIAVFLMLTGISLFGLLTARIAAFFVEEEQQSTPDPHLEQILERLDQLEQTNRELIQQIQASAHDPSTNPKASYSPQDGDSRQS